MSDLISRQAAIDAFINVYVTIGRGNGKSVAFKIANDYADIVKKRIESLPSVQPEIIRCKDCAKREYCRTSTVWAVAPSDDWYCADAEPHKGEQE